MRCATIQTAPQRVPRITSAQRVPECDPGHIGPVALRPYEARRLRLRYRTQDGNVRFVHTLNNTVIASPRILIPLLELNQRADGSVAIPEVLQPYMGGLHEIVPG